MDSRPLPFLPGLEDARPSGDAPGTPGCIVNSVSAFLLCWGDDIVDLRQSFTPGFRFILLSIASYPEANGTQGTQGTESDLPIITYYREWR